MSIDLEPPVPLAVSAASSPVRDEAPGSTVIRDELWLASFLKQRPRLVERALRIVGSVDDAEDIVEDVLVRLLLAHRSRRFMFSTGYFHVAVRNAAFNWRRIETARTRQLVLGGSWSNLGALHFVWRDSVSIPAVPQLLVIERTIHIDRRRITVRGERVLARAYGLHAMRETLF